MFPKRNFSPSTGLVAFACLLAAFVYILALTPQIGNGYDDGVYVGLAQSLAQGKGYAQLPVPGVPPESQYPPGWSLILSAIWLIAPQFPANAILFKLVSVFFTIAFAVLVYRWMLWRSDDKNVSAVISLLMLFNPLILGYATSAFSEMAFAASSILALWLIEKYARSQTTTWGSALSPALAVVWVFYLRSFGITLFVAAIIYLTLARPRRRVVPFAIFSLAGIVPWFVRGLFLPKEAWTYTTQFLLKSMEQPELGVIGWGDLILRVILNLRAYLLAGLPGALLPSQVPLTFVNLDEMLRVGAPLAGFDIVLALILAAGLASQILLRRSLVDWYLLCYLGLGLMWPWEPTRFIVPLIPLLYASVFAQMGLVGAAMPMRVKRIARGAGIAVIALFLIANVAVQVRYASTIYQMPQVSPDWSARGRAFDWIRAHTAASSVLAAMNDYQVYLYTDRQTIRDLGSLAALKNYNVDYVVLIPYGGVMVDGDLSRIRFDPLQRAYPSAFQNVYEDLSAGIQIFHIER